MYHFQVIHQLLNGLPNKAQPVLAPASYIKETIASALQREPGMHDFEHPVACVVNALDTQRDHDLYDVVIRLIYAGVRALPNL